MKKINLLIIISFIFFSIGCAPKINILTNEGIKAPEYVYTESNISTGIKIQMFMASMYSQGDDNYYAYPDEYLDVGNPNKIHKIERSAVSIAGSIRVLNPKKVNYTIKTIYKEKHESFDFPYVTSHVLYKGNKKEKLFDFNKMIEYKPLINYHVVLLKDGMELFNIQTNYKVK